MQLWHNCFFTSVVQCQRCDRTKHSSITASLNLWLWKIRSLEEEKRCVTSLQLPAPRAVGFHVKCLRSNCAWQIKTIKLRTEHSLETGLSSLTFVLATRLKWRLLRRSKCFLCSPTSKSGSSDTGAAEENIHPAHPGIMSGHWHLSIVFMFQNISNLSFLSVSCSCLQSTASSKASSVGEAHPTHPMAIPKTGSEDP